LDKDEIKQTVNESLARHHRREKDNEDGDRFAKIRQWLNIIFMIGAVLGIAIYFLSNQHTGFIIIVGAMMVKFIECVLRLLK